MGVGSGSEFCFSVLFLMGGIVVLIVFVVVGVCGFFACVWFGLLLLVFLGLVLCFVCWFVWISLEAGTICIAVRWVRNMVWWPIHVSRCVRFSRLCHMSCMNCFCWFEVS